MPRCPPAKNGRPAQGTRISRANNEQRFNKGADEEPWQTKEQSGRTPVDSGPGLRLGLGSFSRTGHLACSTVAEGQGLHVGLVTVSH